MARRCGEKQVWRLVWGGGRSDDSSKERRGTAGDLMQCAGQSCSVQGDETETKAGTALLGSLLVEECSPAHQGPVTQSFRYVRK